MGRSLRRLFDGRTMTRTFFRRDGARGPSCRGRIECHSTFLLFCHDDEMGLPHCPRTGYAQITDVTDKGFTVMFPSPFDGWDGFRYVLGD